MCLVVDVYADKKPFKNGGECSSSGDSYICSCVEGFQGKKIAKLVSKSLTKNVSTMKEWGYCNTFGQNFDGFILKNESLKLTR